MGSFFVSPAYLRTYDDVKASGSSHHLTYSPKRRRGHSDGRVMIPGIGKEEEVT